MNLKGLTETVFCTEIEIKKTILDPTTDSDDDMEVFLFHPVVREGL